MILETEKQDKFFLKTLETIHAFILFRRKYELRSKRIINIFIKRLSKILKLLDIDEILLLKKYLDKALDEKIEDVLYDNRKLKENKN